MQKSIFLCMVQMDFLPMTAGNPVMLAI